MQYILNEIQKEIDKFNKALEQGTKEFEKVISGLERKNQFMKQNNPQYEEEKTINGKSAFRLFDTFGFPIEITKEMAEEDMDVFMKAVQDAYWEVKKINKEKRKRRH